MRGYSGKATKWVDFVRTGSTQRKREEPCPKETLRNSGRYVKRFVPPDGLPARAAVTSRLLFWTREMSTSGPHVARDEDGLRPTGAPGQSLEAADKEFAFIDHLGGEVVVKGEEEFFVTHDFALPGIAIDGLELSKLVVGEVESVPVQVVVFRGPADGGLLAAHTAADAVDDPFEDAHVFGVAGPE